MFSPLTLVSGTFNPFFRVSFFPKNFKLDFAIIFIPVYLFIYLRSFSSKSTMAHAAEIKVYKSVGELEVGLEELLRTSAAESIAKRGKFLLGVSGEIPFVQLHS